MVDRQSHIGFEPTQKVLNKVCASFKYWGLWGQTWVRNMLPALTIQYILQATRCSVSTPIDSSAPWARRATVPSTHDPDKQDRRPEAAKAKSREPHKENQGGGGLGGKTATGDG